jgi:hypothetical protein
MTNTSLSYGFTLIHAPSGTSREIVARGEGADAGDKSTPKAATGALKDALRKAFILETGDDPDNTPSSELEQRSSQRQPPPAAAKKAVQPAKPALDPAWTKEAFLKAAEGLGYDAAAIGRILPAKFKPYKPEIHVEALALLQAEHDKAAKEASK